jgi:hypothetical protein
MGFLSGFGNMFGGGMDDLVQRGEALAKPSMLDGLFHGPQQITGGQVDGQGLLQPPTMEKGPGLLERARTADPNTGLSFADKLYMLGSAARDEGPDPMKYAQQRRQEAQAGADRGRRNQAFKAAYQGGKFDPAAYASALGDSNVDPSDIAALTNAFRSKRQILQNAHGIFSADPDAEDGDLQALQEFEPQERVSPGFEQQPDGSWAPIKGGPYDPDYIARTTGVRRDAVVNRPMPRSSGGRGGRGGSSYAPPLPPGFVMEK